MKTHQRNGFTLIELIVVIAILAILALLIVPQVTGYTKQSQAAVCKNNMATIIREYTYDYLMPDPENRFDISKHISATNDICPAHGIITYQEDKTNHVLTLSCSEHGSLSSTDLAFSSNVIGNLTKITRSNSTQSLMDYLNRPNKKTTVDSESTTANSMTDAITSYLEKYNLTPTNSSWQIKKDGSNYVIIVTSKKLTSADYNAKNIAAVEYVYSSDGTYQSTKSGTVSVIEYSGVAVHYPMIDAFTAAK